MTAMDAPQGSQEGWVRGQGRSAAELAGLAPRAARPTPEQAAVVEAPAAPTLVVAGAGSGKTTTLALRILYLLDHAERLFGAPLSPEQVLCLTFTRKAAGELAARSSRAVQAVFGGGAELAPPAVMTYNAYANSLVAEHGLRLGVDPDSALLTDAALWQIADEVVSGWEGDLDIDLAPSTVVAQVAALAGQLRDHGVDPDSLDAWATKVVDHIQALDWWPEGRRNTTPSQDGLALLKKASHLRSAMPLVRRFEQRKREVHGIAYADQVALGLRLAGVREVREVERARYRAVLLDEFQDTSPSQLALFAELFGPQAAVMAVGDPHQAIYGFRGASEAALPAFVDRFEVPRERQLGLSVSFRNSAGVLRVANVASAPLREGSRVPVAPLEARPGAVDAPGPAVESAVPLTEREQASAVVEFCVRERAAGGPDGRGLDGSGVGQVAVLCRRRADFDWVARALEQAGVPYEVVGLGGLLDTPAVADLVALLRVASDPSRGDTMMRLLASERVALGPRDLAALGDWALQLSEDRDDADLRASIVDALAELPRDGWVSHAGRGLSAAARERLAALAQVVLDIRRHAYLPLPELVAFAMRRWGLDVEAAVAAGGDALPSQLDAFADAVRGFVDSVERPTLSALVAWLEAVRQQEDGLEPPVREPDPSRVQVLTVHAAKGLEWDAVAVVGLTDQHFPYFRNPSTKQASRDKGWLGETLALPWELRSDAADLPRLEWEQAGDQQQIEQLSLDFYDRATEHHVAEERRLFYVALTRARRRVLLASSWWGPQKEPRPLSRFVTELLEAGVVSDQGWAPQPRPGEEKPEEPEGEAVLWPPEPTPRQRGLRQLAAEVREQAERLALRPGEPIPADSRLPLAAQTAAMLAERAARSAAVAEVALPPHLSSTALVSMARDRDGFALQLRRPVPAQPTVAAQRGSIFHAQVERFYGHHALLDDDYLDSEEPGVVDPALMEAFERSEWADRKPSHIEKDVEVPVGGVVLRCRMDAVFPPGKGLDKVTVVDWKSGAPPADASERAAREVQLSVYRLAWARWQGLDLDQVDAAFFYASTGETVHPERLLDEGQILGLLQGPTSLYPTPGPTLSM